MSLLRRTGLTFLVLACMAAAAPAQMPGGTPFSADMTMTSRAGEAGKGKVYFNASKWRMDMNMQAHEAIMIFDGGDKIGYMLMPDQKMYMEMHTDQEGGMGMMGRGPRMPKAKPVDPSNPCAGDENMTCKKTGTETVNGRVTDRWDFTSKDGKDNYTAWVDQKLHFPIKTQSSGGDGMELNNVQEGPQAASLFEIPSGYRKFDMGEMMKGMRR